MAAWIVGIKLSRMGLLLATAIGDDLDRWGADLNVPRKPGELDDPYRVRLKKSLVRSKVTRSAIELYINDVTGLTTTVYEPWRNQDIRCNRNPLNPNPVDLNYGRSGTMRRTNPYYMGGVVDIVTVDYSPITQEITEDVIAAGIKPYWTVINGGDSSPIFFGDPTIPLDDIVIEYTQLVRDPFFPIVHSVRGARSGAGFFTVEDFGFEQDNHGYLMTQVMDRPDLGLGYTVYDSPITWDTVGNQTWDDVILRGHSVQMSADVIVGP